MRKTVTIRHAKEELDNMRVGQLITFNTKDLNAYQAARNTFFKSGKIFQIQKNTIIRLEDINE